MLIDSNAYVGHWPFRQLKDNTCKGLLERMNKFDIDASVVSNLNGVFYKNTQNANEELYEEIKSNKQFEGRFIPFAVINPIYNGWQLDLETCHKKMGIKGIRLHPVYHGYELDNPYCIELVKMARDRGLVVALSLRLVDVRPSSWLDVDKEWSLKDILPIIKAVPDAKFLILNVSGSTALNTDETALFKKTDWVMDTSGRNIAELGDMLKQYGKEKFAFGTHGPLLDYRTGLLRVEALRDNEADARTKELLRAGNIKRFLKI